MDEQMTQPRILLIEDTLSMQLMYKTILERGGYEVDVAATANEGLRHFSAVRHEVVVLDLGLPDGDGISVMKNILGLSEVTKVVVVTTNGTLTNAVDAMREGAFDFLVKPMSDTRLLASVSNACRQIVLESSVSQGKGPNSNSPAPDLRPLMGSSMAMTELRRRILSIAPTETVVFITGESGTGKTVAAKNIHFESNRSASTFISFDVRSMDEHEQYRELLGDVHEKGLIEKANDGTLFIDDVCLLEKRTQGGLLHFMQTATLPNKKEMKPLNVRIICATKLDPLVEVENGRFREDLYYHLNVVPMHLPPLRQRQRDVVEIAQLFAAEFAGKENCPSPIFSASAVDALLNHKFPGNLQQLLSVIRKAYHISDGRIIDLEHLGAEFLVEMEHAGTHHIRQILEGENLFNEGEIKIAAEKMVGLSLAEIEQRVINSTLTKFNGSVVRSAEVLGVAPSTLYRKIEQWKDANNNQPKE